MYIKEEHKCAMCGHVRTKCLPFSKKVQLVAMNHVSG